jgi:hypothetical protein
VATVGFLLDLTIDSKRIEIPTAIAMSTTNAINRPKAAKTATKKLEIILPR